MTNSVSYCKIQNIAVEIFGVVLTTHTNIGGKEPRKEATIYCTLQHLPFPISQSPVAEIASLTYEIASHMGSKISELLGA